MAWWKSIGGAGVLVAAVLACQEKLTSPGDCPQLCPGQQVVLDTSLTPISNGDSSFIGYTLPGQGNSLRVSNQFSASDDRGVIRFLPRPDSIAVFSPDTTVSYSIDSVALEVSVLAQDTTVKGLAVLLYRLPVAVADSNVSFTDVESQLNPANRLDSLPVTDTIARPRLRAVFSGPRLGLIDIPAQDSGQLAIGLAIRAPVSTGVRIGSAAAGSNAPTFTTYVTADTPDTAQQKRSIVRVVGFNTYVSQTTPPADPDLLFVGGAPASRALLRFQLPPNIRDSAQVLRATLELTPTMPMLGLRGDTALLSVNQILVDLGAKSPVSTSRSATVALGAVPIDSTIRVEIVQLVQSWQGDRGLPSAVISAIIPEASSFTAGAFGSSRTPGLEPRLRITYALPFPFERP